MTARIAIVGATGVVGREMLRILEDRTALAGEVHAVTSERSAGKTVPFRGAELTCTALEKFDFSSVDIVLMAAGGSVAEAWAPKIADQGPLVIDNSSHFRMKEGIPLIVPEVNPEDLQNSRSRIIANPNCSTAQLVVALKPLHDLFGIRRVVVSTYQSVSGAGAAAMEELSGKGSGAFTKPIIGNVIPHIDKFLEDGSTKEEWKMTAETAKIVDPAIKLIATCVRVPVAVGHSEAVNIECEKPVTVEAARAALEAAPGIVVIDTREDGGYATPLETAGTDPSYVSRLRLDPTAENALSFWVVSDNLRKGAALNAVQIAELALEQKLAR